jgi:hypothetical protein
MPDVILSDVVVRHLAYHARMATLFAAAGNTTESASEALLVSTILDLHAPAMHSTRSPTTCPPYEWPTQAPQLSLLPVDAPTTSPWSSSAISSVKVTSTVPTYTKPSQ